MNQDRAKKLLPVLRAFAEGKEIQERRRTEADGSWGEWSDFEAGDACMISYDNYDYRIKPKPREFWVCWDSVIDEGDHCERPRASVYPYPAFSDEATDKWFNRIKVREVIE